MAKSANTTDQQPAETAVNVPTTGDPSTPAVQVQATSPTYVSGEHDVTVRTVVASSTGRPVIAVGKASKSGSYSYADVTPMGRFVGEQLETKPGADADGDKRDDLLAVYLGTLGWVQVSIDSGPLQVTQSDQP